MKKEKDNKTAEEQQKQDNENVGKMSGLGAGVITGAAIGTSILPVVGTFAGAVVGGVVGSEVGKKYGGKLLDKLNSKTDESTQNSASAGHKTDITAELERLAALHKQGVLDDEEFKAAKSALLKNL